MSRRNRGKAGHRTKYGAKRTKGAKPVLDYSQSRGGIRL